MAAGIASDPLRLHRLGAEEHLPPALLRWLEDPSIIATLAPGSPPEGPVRRWRPDPEAQRPVRVWLAVYGPDDTPVGAIRATGSELAYLVAPALHGRGVGTRMLARALATVLPTAGLSCVRAAMLRDAIASRRLVERAGFAFLGIRTAGFGSARADALVYSRAVSLAAVRPEPARASP